MMFGYLKTYQIGRCDVAFIEPIHHNKPNITYLLIKLVLYLSLLDMTCNETVIWETIICLSGTLVVCHICGISGTLPLGTKLLKQHNTQSNNHRLLSMLPQTKNISKSKQEGTVCQG